MKISAVLVLLFSPSIFFSPTPKDCGEVPELNQKIVAYIKTKINKKVGKGECWDLAAEALNFTGAKWDHDYEFGKVVDLKKNDCVFPGDIMQFESVEIEYRENNTIYHEELKHHTAIIYQVKDKADFIVAQQNTTTHGRCVSLDPLNLKNILKGRFMVYRPVK